MEVQVGHFSSLDAESDRTINVFVAELSLGQATGEFDVVGASEGWPVSRASRFDAG
jgi:hypothetical protein